MWYEDPKFIAGFIAAITSVITVILSLLLKTLYEKRFHVFKLEAEYKYEQQKNIKEILSRNKIQLLNRCESLNNRLWNLSEKYTHEWNRVDGDYTNQKNYYFNSFVYRIISVYSWIRKIESEMIYWDTTIASKDDLYFLKYLRLFPVLLTNIDTLFKGFEYDGDYENDHFFIGNLERMADSLIVDGEVCSFTDFQTQLKKYMPKLKLLCTFIDGLSPKEERLRWDRLQLLHITVIAFLNSFGYDFQYTDEDRISTIIQQPRASQIINNYDAIVERYRLKDQNEMEKILKIISTLSHDSE